MVSTRFNGIIIVFPPCSAFLSWEEDSDWQRSVAGFPQGHTPFPAAVPYKNVFVVFTREDVTVMATLLMQARRYDQGTTTFSPEGKQR